MTQKRIIPNGTAGNTVFAADDSANISQVIFAGTGTVTYVADPMDRGTVAIRCYSPALADTAQIVMTNTAAASVSMQVYFKANTAFPTAAAHLMGARNATVNAIQARYQTAGTILLYDAAGANPVTLTPSPALVVGNIYCLEIDCTPGATTSSGTARMRLYDNDDTLIGDTGALTGRNYIGAGSANITSVRAGDPDTALGTGYDITFWGLACNTTATVTDIAFYAKTVNAAPTGSITTASSPWTQNDEVPLRGTASDSDGTIASTTWSIFSYPAALAAAPTVTNPTSLNSTAKFTPLLAGTYVVRLTLIDDDGGTTIIDKTLTVSLATQTSDLVWNGTAWV